MKYISYLFQLLLALYVAQYASAFVIGRQYFYIVGLLGGGIIFFISSYKQKFLFFSLMVFFPLLMARAFPLPMKTIVEVIAPILFIASVIECIKRRQTLYSRKANVHFIAIGILVLCAIIHYILNPVLGQLSFGSTMVKGGVQKYYFIFAGITTFLTAYLFMKNNELNADRYLIALLVISLVVGHLHMIGLFTNVPFISSLKLGSHHITPETRQYSSIPLRAMAMLGISLLLSLFHYRKWGATFVFVLLNNIVFLVFGGGRSNLPAAVFLLFAYVTFINRKYLVPVVIIVLIITGLSVLFMYDVDLSEYKFGRAFKLQGGLEEQSEERYYTFIYMLEVFKQSPIIGKGVGFQKLQDAQEFLAMYPSAIQYIKYIELMSMGGGHGSYMSILAIFGIAGFYWLIVMIWGGMFYAYKFIHKYKNISRQDTIIAIFVFLHLTALAFTLVAGGGGGYDNMKLWFLAGVVAGLISKDMPKDVIAMEAV